MAVADGAVSVLSDNRSGHDIDLSELSCPCAAFLFECVPHTVVQILILRTAVGEVECLPHGLVAPAEVGGRRKMASCPSRSPVVIIVRLRQQDSVVRAEELSFPHGISVGLILGQLVCYPFGSLCEDIIRRYIALIFYKIISTFYCRELKS